MTVEIIGLTRVLSDEEAKGLANKRVPAQEPTPLPPGDVLLVDADTGAPLTLIASMPEAEREACRHAIMRQRHRFGTVARAGGMASKTNAFGFVAPSAMMRRIAPSVAAWATHDPEGHNTIASFAHQAQGILTDLGPTSPNAANVAARANVHPDWRMGDTCWTSGIVNDTAGLYYHYDRNNVIGTWSAMFTLRAGTRGGHFHIAEHNITLPSRDGDLYFFPAMRMMHGVTPITSSLKGGYRFTAVYYSVKRFQNAPSSADALHRAQARQVELEDGLIERQKNSGLIQ